MYVIPGKSGDSREIWFREGPGPILFGDARLEGGVFGPPPCPLLSFPEQVGSLSLDTLSLDTLIISCRCLR